MQNSYKLNWLEMDTKNIVSGVTADGVKYLEVFLQDYTKSFQKKVNPSCNNCIANYLKEYKEKFQIMENKTDYRLHKKREGLQLQFGSKIHVTNANLTNQYAEILIKRYAIHKGDEAIEFLFDIYPKGLQVKDILKKENTGSSDNKNVSEKKDSELSLKELREKYPHIKATSVKVFLEKLES